MRTGTPAAAAGRRFPAPQLPAPHPDASALCGVVVVSDPCAGESDGGAAEPEFSGDRSGERVGAVGASPSSSDSTRVDALVTRKELLDERSWERSAGSNSSTTCRHPHAVRSSLLPSILMASTLMETMRPSEREPMHATQGGLAPPQQNCSRNKRISVAIVHYISCSKCGVRRAQLYSGRTLRLLRGPLYLRDPLNGDANSRRRGIQPPRERLVPPIRRPPRRGTQRDPPSHAPLHVMHLLPPVVSESDAGGSRRGFPGLVGRTGLETFKRPIQHGSVCKARRTNPRVRVQGAPYQPGAPCGPCARRWA